MTDQRRRELERRSQQGDAEAAERLYWDDLRVGLGGVQLLDKLVETVLTLANKRAPTVWDKIAFVRGLPSVPLSAEEMVELSDRWRRVRSAAELHRVPRSLRQPGFTTYATEDRTVYRVDVEGKWSRLASLTAAPPIHPFYVVETLAERDRLPGHGSCLVLANGGIYKSIGRRGPRGANRHSAIEWAPVRFEKIRSSTWNTQS